jgi:cobaltochelatase CobN
MILILTTADTEILALSQAVSALPDDFTPVRAANPSSLDVEATERLLDELDPRVVVVRLLGGIRAWEDGFRYLQHSCAGRGIHLVALPGDQQADAQLAAACTVAPEVSQRAYEYFQHGGARNLKQLLRYVANAALGTTYEVQPARELSWEGVYHPRLGGETTLEDLRKRWRADCPAVGIIFYRAHWMSGNLAWVDALIEALELAGANVLPLFCYSLLHGAERDASSPPPVVQRYLMNDSGAPIVDTLISTLSFSLARVTVQGAALADGWSAEILDLLDVPVLQAIVSTGSRQRWADSSGGLSPIDTAMNVAMPEFDGRIITVPICFKETVHQDPRIGGAVSRYVADDERIRMLAGLAIRWASLRRKANADKRVAFVLSNYPTRNARIGNAVGLDTPASLLNILREMLRSGYTTGELPETGDNLIHALIDRCSYDTEFLTEAQIDSAPGQVTGARYQEWFDDLQPTVREELRESWGDPPGAVYCTDGRLMVPGLEFGNVFVGIQPPRGFGENPVAIYHNPDLPPTHHYLGFYRWLRDDFRADAVVHVGKHGTLEWLPGKAVGLSAACYPDAVLQDMPHFYPFIVNNPGEGAQAKRRAHATIIDHLIPAMTTAESYNEIMALEQHMDEYYQVQTLDPAKLPIVRQRIWEIVRSARLDEDLGEQHVPDDFDAFLLHLDGYICELKDALIRDGLHIFGQPPTGEQEAGLLLALTRLENPGMPSLRAAIATAAGLDYEVLAKEPGERFEGVLPKMLNGVVDSAAVRLNGDVIERIESVGRGLIGEIQRGTLAEEPPLPLGEGWGEGPATSSATSMESSPRPSPTARGSSLETVLNAIQTTLRPALARTTDEITNLLRGLDGRYVPAGPSGAPTRGLANVLPTGRNFYSVDPNTIPSTAAWEVGRGLADRLLERYLEDEGHYPETVGLVIWGTSAMRTHGDDIAEALWLLGVRPVWQAENRRVRGLDVISLEELGRPRIDVTVRISGFFRDAFPNLMHLLDDAVRMVADLDEPDDMNYVAAHVRSEVAAARGLGVDPAIAREQSLYRVFGSKPGTYGAGILPLLDERSWESDEDLANVYRAWGCYAYTRQDYGREAPAEFDRRFGQIVVAVKNQDNREHDIFDSDDYMQFHGGMIATIRALTGSNPTRYFGDSSNPTAPRVRDLADEARRVFRTRVINPKWIASVQRHGYKGAFEMAATMDYLFGYDATAQVVEDWMYERVAQAYVLDPEVRKFFEEKNPWALRSIVERLFEAADRGLWEHPREEITEAMRQIYLETEGNLEGRGE